MTQIKLRRDTAANWATANSVLAQGEPGLDTTNNIVKYGDGSTHWSDLPYPNYEVLAEPNIQYTGTFGAMPTFWRYSSSHPIQQYTSNGTFRASGSSLYWLDQNFDDADYDLSGLTSIRFTNIGGIKGYLDFSDKSEVVLTALNLGEIEVVDEWVRFGGFSNTLATFAANNLIDVGGYFEIYGNQLVDGPTWSFPALDRVTDNLTIDYNWNTPFSNTAAPTFPELSYVGNGIYIYYNRYTSWSDFTSLAFIQNNFQFRDNTSGDSELYSGPGLPALVRLQFGSLQYYNNDYMQSISEFAALTRIDGSMEMYQNPELESFPSFPVLEYCAGINASYCGSMTTYDGDDFLPSLLFLDGDLNFRNNQLTSQAVDDILVRLASLDGTGGTTSYSNRSVYLDQGTNGIPTQTGLDAKATLEGRGCSVAVNS